MKPKIYLAGWSGETEYRKYWMKFEDKIDLIDPMETEKSILASNGDSTVNIENKIVSNDKQLIENCDFLVAYITRLTAGTSMEILHAWNCIKPTIFIINPNFEFKNDIWLNYHADKFFKTHDECFEFIMHCEFL